MRKRTVRKTVMVASLWLAVVADSPASASPSEPTRLTAAAGTADAKFGTSVSIEGNTAVVGAPDEDGAQDGMGAAYVFTRRGAVWTEEAMLVASDPAQGGKLGYDVGLSGDTIVVGAPNADQTIPEPGAAYVFVRTRDGWVHQAKLSASDGKTDDAFGFAVAVSGDTIVVGANDGTAAPGATAGAAYVFTRAGGVWSEQAKLTPADGAPDDGFGSSVVVSGDTAVVGMPGDDVGVALEQGSARVFTRNGTTWTEQATLTAQDVSPADMLGASVSILSDTVVVGAPAGSSGTNPAHGSAYVFTREGEAWTQEAKLTAPDGAPLDQFGRSVAVTADTVAVGAHFNDPGGAVYLFDRVHERWDEPTMLRADGSALLGVSMAMSGHTVIGGANFTAIDGRAAQGAAYVFDLRLPPTELVAAGAAPSAPSGSATGAADPERRLDQSQAGPTLPSTGSDTTARTLVALTALALGWWLLVLSGRASATRRRHSVV